MLSPLSKTHVIFSDDTVYSFGTNTYGTLGDGSGMATIGDTPGEAAVEMKFTF